MKGEGTCRPSKDLKGYAGGSKGNFNGGEEIGHTTLKKEHHLSLKNRKGNVPSD